MLPERSGFTILSMNLTGDGSANEIEFWCKGDGSWILIGKSELKDIATKELTLSLSEESNQFKQLRFVIAQKAGKSSGKILIRALELKN